MELIIKTVKSVRKNGFLSTFDKTLNFLLRNSTIFNMFYFKLYIAVSKCTKNFNIQSKFIHNIYFDDLIYIKPDNVEFGLKKSLNPRHKFIYDGNWDRENIGLLWSEDFSKNTFTVAGYTSIKELFIEYKHYKQTKQYKYMKKNMEDGLYNKSYGCKSIEEIDDYFKKLFKTYNLIKHKGYKSQKELENKYPELIKKNNDEIKIYVNREGRLIQGRGGSHRLAIAKVLNLNEVPVIIRGVHKEWALDKFNQYNKNLLESIKLALKNKDFKESKNVR